MFLLRFLIVPMFLTCTMAQASADPCSHYSDDREVLRVAHDGYECGEKNIEILMKTEWTPIVTNKYFLGNSQWRWSITDTEDFQETCYCLTDEGGEHQKTIMSESKDGRFRAFFSSITDKKQSILCQRYDYVRKEWVLIKEIEFQSGLESRFSLAYDEGDLIIILKPLSNGDRASSVVLIVDI